MKRIDAEHLLARIFRHLQPEHLSNAGFQFVSPSRARFQMITEQSIQTVRPTSAHIQRGVGLSTQSGCVWRAVHRIACLSWPSAAANLTTIDLPYASDFRCGIHVDLTWALRYSAFFSIWNASICAVFGAFCACKARQCWCSLVQKYASSICNTLSAPVVIASANPVASVMMWSP